MGDGDQHLVDRGCALGQVQGDGTRGQLARSLGRTAYLSTVRHFAGRPALPAAARDKVYLAFTAMVVSATTTSARRVRGELPGAAVDEFARALFGGNGPRLSIGTDDSASLAMAVAIGT